MIYQVRVNSWLFCIIISCIFSYSLFSQNIVNQEKNFQFNDGPYWETAIDMLWLINKNQLSATSIFFRRHNGKQGTNSGALRFRVGLDADDRDSLLGARRASGRYDQMLGVFIRVGYEQQINKRRTQVFYGADVHFAYQYNRYTEKGYITVPFQKTRNTSVGLVGVGGVKYHISPYFAISLESTLSFIAGFGYEQNDVVRPETPDPNLPAIRDLRRVNSNDFTINLIPLTVVNACFNFKRRKTK